MRVLFFPIPLPAIRISNLFLEGTESPLFVSVNMELLSQIRSLVEQTVQGNCFVLDVRVNMRLNPPRINVIVDGDTGVTIDDCANISRAINDSMHQQNILEDYNLEVSTPGIEQPLKLQRQYPKHIGRNLKIELKENEVARGKLQAVEGNSITIEEEANKKEKKAGTNIRKINFEQINKTFVQVSFK